MIDSKILKNISSGVNQYDMKLLQKFFIEIIDKDKKTVELIFRHKSIIDSACRNECELDNDFINKLTKSEQNENITYKFYLIFDFDSLFLDLEMSKVIRIYNRFNERFSLLTNRPLLYLIIQNCRIKEDNNTPYYNKKLILDGLEIKDELYTFSTNLNKIFVPNSIEQIKSIKLTNFKFCSKQQLEELKLFLKNKKCERLELNNICIELILQKDENDEDYNQLDTFFIYKEQTISFGDIKLPELKTLILKDTPLFFVSENILKCEDNQKHLINIDVDKNSIINQNILSKFTIKNNEYYLTIDLDNFNFYHKNYIEGDFEEDYLKQMEIIFYMLLYSTERVIDNSKMREQFYIGPISHKNIKKIKLKNFNMTQSEYIAGENGICVDLFKDEKNKNIIDKLLSDEEKKKKDKWSNFKQKLIDKYNDNNFPNLNEIVFDNCSSFIIGCFFAIQNNKHFNKLKLKKCAKDIINTKIFEKIKSIDNLEIFDVILDVPYNIIEKDKNKVEDINIINDENNDMDDNDINEDNINKQYLFPDIKYKKIIIGLNSLDYYGMSNSLNTLNVYEIIQKFLESEKNFNDSEKISFNNNNCITFRMQSLALFLKYLFYKVSRKEREIEEKNRQDKKENEQAVNTLQEKDKSNKPNQTNKIENEDEENYRIIQGLKYYDKNLDRINDKNLPQHIFLKDEAEEKREEKIKECFRNLDSNTVKYLPFKTITLKDILIRHKIEMYDPNSNKKQPKLDDPGKDVSEKYDAGKTNFNYDLIYRYFFSEQQTETVILENCQFINSFKNTLSIKEDYESFFNMTWYLQNEAKKFNSQCQDLDLKKITYHFPNYIIDYTTINNIFFKNYLFEDVSDLIKHIKKKLVLNGMNDEGENILKTENIELFNRFYEAEVFYSYYMKFLIYFMDEKGQREKYSNEKKPKITIKCNSKEDKIQLVCFAKILKKLAEKFDFHHENFFEGEIQKITYIRDEDRKTTYSILKYEEIKDDIQQFFLEEKNELNSGNINEITQINYYNQCNLKLEEFEIIPNNKYTFKIPVINNFT